MNTYQYTDLSNLGLESEKLEFTETVILGVHITFIGLVSTKFTCHYQLWN